MARALFGPGAFIEIHVDTPLSAAEEKDPKGLYKKARQGLLRNFTGIDSPHESPQSPEIHLPTTEGSAEEMAERVIAHLQEKNLPNNPLEENP